MSNMNLPDPARILSLARSYKRAAGARRRARAALSVNSRSDSPEARKWFRADSAFNHARDQLLIFIESGQHKNRKRRDS
jgi:hypothetical protein